MASEVCSQPVAPVVYITRPVPCENYDKSRCFNEKCHKCDKSLHKTNTIVFTILGDKISQIAIVYNHYWENSYIYLCYSFSNWSGLLALQASWKINNVGKGDNFRSDST